MRCGAARDEVEEVEERGNGKIEMMKKERRETKGAGVCEPVCAWWREREEEVVRSCARS